jgi:AcrR family transcriptional regulator
VAALDGKTRGAITNLFGSQAAFQAATMDLVLSVGDWIERIPYPEPQDHAVAEEWFDALLAGESARGPRHGAEPAVDYAFLWALWLSAVPYGMWSERVSEASVAEHVLWVGRLEHVLVEALEHFDRVLYDGVTPGDLAAGLASLVEGVWLNQCLTDRHPTVSEEPISTSMLRGGRLLWRGAVAPEAP